jgi:hypothetical protein
MDIFEVGSNATQFHPGSGYRAVIHDAASAVLDDNREQPSSLAQDPTHPAFQSLFDMLDDTMYDWPNLYNESASTSYDLANIWNAQ